MATNPISLVMEFLAPDMIGRIATAVERDRNKAHSAISNAVPASLIVFRGLESNNGSGSDF